TEPGRVSDVLDLSVLGDPVAVRTAATDAGTVRTAVSTAADDVRRALTTVGSWQGSGGVAYEDRLTAAERDLRELDRRISDLASALTDFAGELDVVRQRMGEARSTAVAGGVRTQGEGLVRPVAPVD